MKLNKYLLLVGLCSASMATITSCKQSSFEELFRDPSKIQSGTLERQYTGIMYSYRELVVPSYWNYFVILRSTAIRYVQATGWANETNQLAPGGASIQDRWNTYYSGLAQFREFEKIYNSLSEEEKAINKIYYLTAKIFFYNQTQQNVDLHGDIPWSEAGMLSTNNGNYEISYAKYDKAEDIYVKMLDDLKLISTELNAISLPTGIANTFRTQDLVNAGDLTLWKKYCNSLRLRLLMRVQGVSSLSARSDAEITEILGNSTAFPLVLSNTDNITIDVFDPASDINSRGFREGIESWNANISSKVMIDHMVTNLDPRLPFIFEPGAGANGTYIGLDQSLSQGDQQAQISGTPAEPSKIAIYNRSTYSRNQKFPGLLISASEVNYLLAEYYARKGNSQSSRQAFESGIKESIAFFQNVRSISNDNTVNAPASPTAQQINNYIANIGWGTNNIQLIATQKWLHFNLVQPLESWSEVRRLDFPVFSFRVEPADLQRVVPVKWNLPSSEVTFNAQNYQAVSSTDNVNTKIFWDVN